MDTEEDQAVNNVKIFRRQKKVALDSAREAYHRRLANADRDVGSLSERQIDLLRSTLSAAEEDLSRFNEEHPFRKF